MNQATKAALISAFICPGGGHFYLKRYNTGTLLSVVTLGALIYLLNQAIARAQDISQQIISGQLPLDLSVIYPLITQPPAADQALYSNIALVAFAASWFVGVIDAYRLGAIADKAVE